MFAAKASTYQAIFSIFTSISCCLGVQQRFFISGNSFECIGNFPINFRFVWESVVSWMISNSEFISVSNVNSMSSTFSSFEKKAKRINSKNSFSWKKCELNCRSGNFSYFLTPENRCQFSPLSNKWNLILSEEFFHENCKKLIFCVWIDMKDHLGLWNEIGWEICMCWLVNGKELPWFFVRAFRRTNWADL